jgi:hypothetical protein
LILSGLTFLFCSTELMTSTTEALTGDSAIDSRHASPKRSSSPIFSQREVTCEYETLLHPGEVLTQFLQNLSGEVREEMDQLAKSIPKVKEHFTILNKIGSGRDQLS